MIIPQNIIINLPTPPISEVTQPKTPEVTQPKTPELTQPKTPEVIQPKTQVEEVPDILETMDIDNSMNESNITMNDSIDPKTQVEEEIFDESDKEEELKTTSITYSGRK